MFKFKYVLLMTMGMLLVGCQQDPNVKKIGIIEPIEVKAMDEIVAGFEQTAQAQSQYKLEFYVQNAQGDMNLQRAIIAEMKAKNFDIVAPIGSDATEMTASIIKQNPIVSLAASVTDADRKKMKPCNMAVVHDEIPPALSIAFLHAAFPNIKNITIVHSAADKILPEVQQTIAAGKQYGINVTDMMAPTLNDIYSVANNIPSNTQAIFVLKDSQIVSGIATLELAAAKRHIALYTSDQGSVQDGAGFALGVHEREIGEAGGNLAAEILAGKNACDLSIVEMKTLTVFVNKNSFTKEAVDLTPVVNAANHLGYKIEMVNGS